VDTLKIFKALGNETRLNILLWLKDPKAHFEPQLHSSVMTDFTDGVCVRSIKDKSGLSQSTISSYMAFLEEVHLVESRKIDQYTYFRLNKKTFSELITWMEIYF
jgi:DNA-binding transcriptional ArsR family regulator